MRSKRNLLWVSAVLLILLGSPALWAAGQKETAGKAAAGEKKISVLTWNISFYEKNIRGWISDFEKENTNTQVEWLDKKGSEWDTFFQTQLAGGNAPDVLDIQGPLFAKYAAMGALLEVGSYINKDAETKGRYNKNIIKSAYTYNGKVYEVPFYFAPSVLYYNKIMFKNAGLKKLPETFDELMNYAGKLTKDEKSGFLTLNFDWYWWPLFRCNGVRLLTPDNKKAAFNTEVAVKTLETLARMTQKGVIAKISWTARWKVPNDAFGAGNIGMYYSNGSAYHNFAKSGAEWVSPDTVGVGSFPGRWTLPGSHGFAINSASKYPEKAWKLVKIITNDKWSEVFIKRTNIFTGNNKIDNEFLKSPELQKDQLKLDILKTQLQNMDRLTGPTIAQDARVKDAFYNELQKALFGEKTAKAALNSAEKAINSILSE